MKLLLSIISSFIFTNCFSQQNLVFPFADKAQFDWKLISKSESRLTVDKFIKSTPGEFEAYKDKDPLISVYRNLDSLRKDLHFIDLNGDGKEDVIFDGASGGEAREIIIFINTGTAYKKVFDAYQCIVKMEWQDKRLKRIFIFDWGCCDAYIDRRMIYEASYNQANIPNFKETFQVLSIHYGVMPDTFLKKPFRFEILNQGYKIRMAPQIDDSSYQRWTEDTAKDVLRGTTIGKLAKGTTGTAIAQKQGEDGRVWLFVQIDEGYVHENAAIYFEDKFPVRLVGWISSRFIKTL